MQARAAALANGETIADVLRAALRSLPRAALTVSRAGPSSIDQTALDDPPQATREPRPQRLRRRVELKERPVDNPECQGHSRDPRRASSSVGPRPN